MCFSHPEGRNGVEGPALWVNCLILFSIFRQMCMLHELKLNLAPSLQGAWHPRRGDGSGVPERRGRRGRRLYNCCQQHCCERENSCCSCCRDRSGVFDKVDTNVHFIFHVITFIFSCPTAWTPNGTNCFWVWDVSVVLWDVQVVQVEKGYPSISGGGGG